MQRPRGRINPGVFKVDRDRSTKFHPAGPQGLWGGLRLILSLVLFSQQPRAVGVSPLNIAHHHSQARQSSIQASYLPSPRGLSHCFILPPGNEISENKPSQVSGLHPSPNSPGGDATNYSLPVEGGCQALNLNLCSACSRPLPSRPPG